MRSVLRGANVRSVLRGANVRPVSECDATSSSRLRQDWAPNRSGICEMSSRPVCGAAGECSSRICCRARRGSSSDSRVEAKEKGRPPKDRKGAQRPPVGEHCHGDAVPRHSTYRRLSAACHTRRCGLGHGPCGHAPLITTASHWSVARGYLPADPLWLSPLPFLSEEYASPGRNAAGGSRRVKSNLDCVGGVWAQAGRRPAKR